MSNSLAICRIDCLAIIALPLSLFTPFFDTCMPTDNLSIPCRPAARQKHAIYPPPTGYFFIVLGVVCVSGLVIAFPSRV